MFQSHNGAIAASCSLCATPVPISGFNPTMVRLLQNDPEAEGFLLIGFNPTMVRLLPRHQNHKVDLMPLFQSHNGAIAAELQGFFAHATIEVSIPQWCDCCA